MTKSKSRKRVASGSSDTAYCVKCKSKVTISNPSMSQTKNGQPMIRGKGGVKRSPLKKPKTSEFWKSENELRGGINYQWGGYNSKVFALKIKEHCDKRDHLKILVCGAGKSMDALELQNAIKNADVLATDFESESVAFQKSLGVKSVQVDLLKFVDSWKESFDVVIDASFTDVFTSNWKGKDVVVHDNKSLTAVRNIIGYVKEGGLFVVNSIIQTDEEYDQFVSTATQGKMKYNPMTVLTASDIGGRSKVKNKYGRTITGGGASNGHVGFWYVT